MVPESHRVALITISERHLHNGHELKQFIRLYSVWSGRARSTRFCDSWKAANDLAKDQELGKNRLKIGDKESGAKIVTGIKNCL